MATQKTLLREQAIEDRIRTIDAKQSGMNPSIKELWKESKDRGLPPRKDIRDALEMIEAEPYVPETFGKKITKRGCCLTRKASAAACLAYSTTRCLSRPMSKP